MATYNDVHLVWTTPTKSLRSAEIDLSVRDGGSWKTSAATVKPYVHVNGNWVAVYDSAASGPRALIRTSGEWASIPVDFLSLKLCSTASGTHDETWTIPSSLFGLTVSKLVISQRVLYSKEVSGSGYTHSLLHNGTTIMSASTNNDGYACSSSSWTQRVNQDDITFTVYPGDTLTSRVIVPSGGEGGTQSIFRGIWYFS